MVHCGWFGLYTERGRSVPVLLSVFDCLILKSEVYALRKELKPQVLVLEQPTPTLVVDCDGALHRGQSRTRFARFGLCRASLPKRKHHERCGNVTETVSLRHNLSTKTGDIYGHKKKTGASGDI